MIRKLFALLLFLAFPEVAHAEWYEASSAHFVVYSNDLPEKVQKYASDLERFDQAVRQLRHFADEPVGKANRVTVFLLSSMDDIGKLAGSGGVAGFYIPRAGGSVAFVPSNGSGGDEDDLSGRTVLFHEYTHHLMFSAFPNSAFPTWMVEGWAEFHGTATINPDGSVLFGSPPRFRQFGAESGSLLRLDRMLADDVGRLDGQETEALYGRGWLLVHYLSFDHSRAGQFDKYIAAINAGEEPAKAAADAFGDWHVLNADLARHLRQPRLTAFTIFANRIHVGTVTVRKLTPGEAATMDVRIVSRAGVDHRSAAGVYAAAKKAAAPYPNDAGAQNELAEAAYDADDFAGSEAAASRAIAADPNAANGYIYKAMSRMAQASKAGDISRATWNDIRRIIASANRIDPDNPKPLSLYFESFADSGEQPSTMAKQGLYRAFELCPQDRELRVTAARTYLADGNTATARAMVQMLLHDPHGGALALAASKILIATDPAQPAKATKDSAKGS